MSAARVSENLGILNVGAGDTKLSFDKNNPAERIRAARIVKDMLRRGYALLIEVERDGRKETTRALGFDENTCEYIIADFDPVTAAAADVHEEANGTTESQERGIEATATEPAPQGAPRRGRPRKTTNVPAENVRGVAVARTSGG